MGKSSAPTLPPQARDKKNHDAQHPWWDWSHPTASLAASLAATFPEQKEQNGGSSSSCSPSLPGEAVPPVVMSEA